MLSLQTPVGYSGAGLGSGPQWGCDEVGTALANAFDTIRLVVHLGSGVFTITSGISHPSGLAHFMHASPDKSKMEANEHQGLTGGQVRSMTFIGGHPQPVLHPLAQGPAHPYPERGAVIVQWFSGNPRTYAAAARMGKNFLSRTGLKHSA